jgi:hypothetical protein
VSALQEFFARCARQAHETAGLTGREGEACTWEVPWPGKPGVIALGAVDWRGNYSVVPTDGEAWAMVCEVRPDEAAGLRRAAMDNLRNHQPGGLLMPNGDRVIEGSIVEPGMP